LNELGDISANYFLREAIKMIATHVARDIEGLDEKFLEYTGGLLEGENGRDIYTNLDFNLHDDAKRELVEEFIPKFLDELKTTLGLDVDIECNFEICRIYNKRRLEIKPSPYEENDPIDHFKENKPELFYSLLEKIQNKHFQEALDYYQNLEKDDFRGMWSPGDPFGEKPFSIGAVGSSLRLAGKTYTDLDPEKTEEEIKAIILKKHNTRCINIAREYFELLKTDFEVRRGDTPDDGVKEFLGYAGASYAALDPEGKKSESEMKAEFRQACALREARVQFKVLCSGAIAMRSNPLESIRKTKKKIEKHIRKSGHGMASLDEEGKWTDEEAQEFLDKRSAEVTRAYKAYQTEQAIEYYGQLKTNFRKNPDEIIAKIKESLEKGKLDYTVIFPEDTTPDEALVKVEKYKKLSAARVAALALYTDDEGINKPELFAFVKRTLSETGFSFSDLDPEAVNGADQIEKELTKLAYSNSNNQNLLGR